MISVLFRVIRTAVVILIAGVVVLNADRLMLAGIHGYQRVLAPAFASAGISCRFTPTCSRYAEIVIRRDGAVRGGWLALKRIARCGPWTAAGTRDDP